MTDLPYMKYFTLSIAILLLFLTYSCTRTEEFAIGKKITCDAEQLNKKGDKFVAQNEFSCDG